jgi:hypothetical protein
MHVKKKGEKGCSGVTVEGEFLGRRATQKFLHFPWGIGLFGMLFIQRKSIPRKIMAQ